ncbi:MAG: NfeD family protein [Cyanobacteria bacterium J083]|nr:MAG: NfeD family protein [Cyanobacteria bacterium J083]
MINPTWLWLIAGAALCLMELIFPTAFVAFMLGVAALLVAIVSLFISNSSILVALWLIFATVLIISSPRLFTPHRRRSTLGEDLEGETITAIAPGKTGRVIYEGNSWQAKCADENLNIPPGEKVCIVNKQGNTLIVLPVNLLKYDS